MLTVDTILEISVFGLNRFEISVLIGSKSRSQQVRNLGLNRFEISVSTGSKSRSQQVESTLPIVVLTSVSTFKTIIDNFKMLILQLNLDLDRYLIFCWELETSKPKSIIFMFSFWPCFPHRARDNFRSRREWPAASWWARPPRRPPWWECRCSSGS